MLAFTVRGVWPVMPVTVRPKPPLPRVNPHMVDPLQAAVLPPTAVASRACTWLPPFERRSLGAGRADGPHGLTREPGAAR